MVIRVVPDQGVPLIEEAKDIDFRSRIAAAAATTELLAQHGADFTPTQEDIEAANALVSAFAQDPEALSREVTTSRVSTLSLGAVIETKRVLDAFGHAVVESAVTIRHLVVNKLIIESDNPNPRIRIRALELLGKMSDVALFTERSEVVVTHQSTEELQQKLRAKFERIRENSLPFTKNADGVFEAEDSALDLAKELGIKS